MRFNTIVERIKPSASMKIGLGNRGDEYLNFAIGAPDLDPPRLVESILKSRLELPDYPYTTSAGTLLARKNIANILSDATNEINPDQVMLCEGAKYGIYIALKTICNKGEKALLIEPYWLSYPHIVASLEMETIIYSPVIENGGKLVYDLNDLVRTSVRENVRVVIINNPNNPSGQIFEFDEIDDLAKQLNAAGIWLLIDEVYKDLIYEREIERSFNISGQNVIRVGSFSKSLCIPGLRLGYMVSQPDILEKLLLVSQHIQTCVNTYALSVAENMDKETLQEHSKYCSLIYKSRYDALSRCLRPTQLKLLFCEASFYAFVDFSAYFPHALDACKFLENKYKVLTTPGHEYGNSFNRYVRICLTLPEVTMVERFNMIVHGGF